MVNKFFDKKGATLLEEELKQNLLNYLTFLPRKELLNYLKQAFNKDGVFLNDVLFSKKTIDLFDLSSAPFIKVSFSIKEDAVHRGGLNLFGRKFGDYDQSIVLTLYP